MKQFLYPAVVFLPATLLNEGIIQSRYIVEDLFSTVNEGSTLMDSPSCCFKKTAPPWG